MLNELLKSNIAIIGGGKFCKDLLQLLYSEHFEDQRPSILGVADVNERAEGLLYAGQKGIFTTADYRDLYQFENLQIIMELTADVRLGALLSQTKPEGVKIVDHVEARTVWTSLQVEKEKREALKVLRQHQNGVPDITSLFGQFADRLGNVIIREAVAIWK